MITFITGNAGKWKEVSAVLGDLVAQKDISLPEIQDLDVMRVIEEKLIAARKIIADGAILVDDSGFYFHALKRLPGVFSKSFLKELGIKGNFDMLEKLGDTTATAYTVLGYMNEAGEIQYFESSGNGSIVAPRGEGGFGFDPIFLPDNSQKTLAEMDDTERLAFKMRTIAVRKLKDFLERQ